MMPVTTKSVFAARSSVSPHDSVDYLVEESVRNRVSELERATGRDGVGQRDIIQRVDELEGHVETLGNK